ncbi:MAG UNVERIFIED_CONTAM: hypothetical protein LVR18_37395 [Planctomycetaceae bacterium]|jgi:hypothetical protein
MLAGTVATGLGERIVGTGPAEGIVFGFVEAGEFEAIHRSGPGDDDGGDFGESGVEECPGESDIADGVIAGSIAKDDADTAAGHTDFLSGGLGGKVGEVEGVEVDAAETRFDACAIDGGGSSGCEPFADFFADGVLFIDVDEGGIAVLHADDGAECGEGNEDFVANFAGFDVDEGVDAAVAGDAERFFALFFEPEFPFLIGRVFREGIFQSKRTVVELPGRSRSEKLRAEPACLTWSVISLGMMKFSSARSCWMVRKFRGSVEGVFNFVDGRVFHHVA